MAKTAEDALFSNYVQIALSVVGAGLLFWTLYYTRRATRAAIVAADAAKESADVAARQTAHMENTAERQLRAYITVDPGGIVQWEPDGNPSSRITARNVGATPAYSVKIAIKVHTISKIPETDITDSADIVMQGDMTIVPGGHRNAGIYPIGILRHDEWREVFLREKWVIVYGYINYRDAFNKEQKTRFCHLYQGDNLGADFVRYHHLGNSAT